MDPQVQARLQHALRSRSEPLLLSARQAAALCGRSVRTWRSWHTSGRVPQPVQIGRSLYWRRSELVAWIQAGCPPRDVWQAMQRMSPSGTTSAARSA